MENLSKKILLALTVLAFSLQTTMAQLGLTVNVHLDEAGTLYAKIQEQIEELGELTDVTDLTVSGKLNKDDQNVLRNQLPNLFTADFSGIEADCALYVLMRDHKRLKSCVLPTAATELVSNVLSSCDSLTSVTLPPVLQAIPYFCLADCEQLASIDIPSTVTKLGMSAFRNCQMLTSVVIPAGVTILPDDVFLGCKNLSSIDFLGSDVTLHYRALSDTGFETFTLPEGVKISGREVFSNCAKLKRFIFPDGLTDETQVGEGTFQYCRQLSSVRLPGNLTCIPTSMFCGTALSTIDIPSTVTRLGDSSFREMSNLQSLSLPAGITAIGKNAFWGSALQTFEWPTGATTIRSETFRSCENLRAITIPETVDSIESGVFLYCSSLERLHLPEGLRTISSSLCTSCTSLKEVNIPAQVTSIPYYAFSKTALTHVDIPDGVTIIDHGAFDGTGLHDLKLPSQLVTIGPYAFNCSRNAFEEVIVPEGVRSIDNSAFYCDSLRRLDLPSTLFFIGGGLLGGMPEAYAKRVSIVFRSPAPPYWDKQPFVYGDYRCTILVPKSTRSLYLADGGYNGVDSIGTIDDDTSAPLRITGETVVTPGSTLEQGQYDVAFVYIWGEGLLCGKDNPRLAIAQGARFHAGKFSMSHDLYSNYWFTSYGYHTFINRGTFEADDIDFTCRFGGRHFFTPPFDVSYDELVALNPAQPMAIFRYDGAARAAADFSNAWVKLKAGEMLRAGQTYCYRGSAVIGYNADGTSYMTFGDIHLKPLQGGTDYFSTAADVSLPLSHYPSEFPHNSNWNAVGNPYPAYLDIRGLDYDGPVMVYEWAENTGSYSWNTNGAWRAYSALDDEVVLNPLQAIFVQTPDGVNALTLSADRRQHNSAFVEGDTENSVRALRRADSRRQRLVYNLTLSRPTDTGLQQLDRTRFVINPTTTTGYDIGHDAPKMSDADEAVDLLYTVADGLAYAINERPLADGIVCLGLQVAEAGTYTLTLDVKGSSSDDVWLIDNATGSRTLLTEPYTFTTTEGGLLQSRFVVALGGAEPSAVESVETALPLSSEGLFNLGGQRMSSLPEGLYIKDGKKVINRK